MEPQTFGEPQSLLEIYYQALGPRYALFLPLMALASFVGALLVVIKGKGPTVGPALVLAVITPVLFGLLGAVDGVIASYLVIAHSPTTPSPAHLALGWGYGLISLKVGVFLAMPTLLVAVIGAIVRALRAPS